MTKENRGKVQFRLKHYNGKIGLQPQKALSGDVFTSCVFSRSPVLSITGLWVKSKVESGGNGGQKRVIGRNAFKEFRSNGIAQLP